MRLEESSTMDSLPMWLLLTLFVASAGVIWGAGILLSETTDALDSRLHLGSAFGGLIVLAVATNLPEVAITVSAAVAVLSVVVAGSQLPPGLVVARMTPDVVLIAALWIVGLLLVQRANRGLP